MSHQVDVQTRLHVVPDDKKSPDDFTEAFRRYYGFVRHVVVGYGVPRTDADDAAQEVFLVLHRRFSDYDGRASFQRWLAGIARRVASDRRRASARKSRRLRLVAASVEAPPGLVRRLERAEAVSFIDRFIQSLPESRRLVFLSAEVQGMTAPEIAEAYGVKLNTVYSRLRLARRAFEAAVRERNRPPSTEAGQRHG